MHATRRQLSELVRGGLPDHNAEHVWQHLDQCDDCMGLLDALMEDELILCVQWGSHESDSVVQERGCRRMLDEILAIPASERSFGRDPKEDAERLAPAAVPQQLGDYRIVHELGRGGMGVVYEAVQQSLNRRVALKLLPLPAVSDPIRIERFRQEARAAARLHHTNIVPVFEVGEEEGIHFFAMQFIDGHGLDKILGDARQARGVVSAKPIPDTSRPHQTQRDPQPSTTLIRSPPAAARRENKGQDDPGSATANRAASPLLAPARPNYYRRVAIMAAQVSDALQYAHSLGILHRDIKPSNLLLDKTGTVWVTDFGLAKHEAENLTQTGDLVGTLRYMAPERFRGESDARSDVYGLGITLYELLTLQTPFDAVDRAHLLKQITDGKPLPPRRLDPRIPRDLETIVLKAIQPEPELRYATAGALAEDLRRFLEYLPISARRGAPIERLRRWSRRNPLVAALTAAVAMLLLALAAGGLAAALGFYQAAEHQQRLREAADRQTEAAVKAAEAENKAHEDLDATAYAQRIALAHREWEVGNVKRARQLLEECPSQFRHWEWNYLQRLCHAEEFTLHSHRANYHRTFTRIVYSPNGKLLVTGSGGWPINWGDVELWDADTGAWIQKLADHRLPIQQLAFSADGTRLASVSGSYDHNHGSTSPGVVKVCDVAKGTLLATYVDTIHSVAFHPDGDQLATVSTDHDILIRSLSSDQVIRKLEAGSVVNQLGYAADGQSLGAACHDGTIKIWDASSGNLRHTLRGHADAVLCLDFRPDGRQLASGSKDTTVRLWNLENPGRLDVLREHQTTVYSVRYSPDGRRLASSSGHDHRLVIWDVPRGGRKLFHIRGHTEAIFDVDFHPRGHRLASASNDKTARVWDVTRRPADISLGRHNWYINSLAVSQDGKHVVTTANDGTARVWDVRDRREVIAFRGHEHLEVNNALFAPDGRHVLSAGDDAVHIWRIADGQIVRTLANPVGVQGLSLSPDGRRLAAGSRNGEIIIWNWETGEELLRFQAHKAFILTVQFSHDGTRLVTCSGDGNSNIGDASAKRSQAQMIDEPSGKVWDASTGKLLFALRGHRGAVREILFDASDERLYSACDVDHTIKVWDAATGKQLHTIDLAGNAVFGIDLTPDGRRLAAACSNGVLKIWDTVSLQELIDLGGYHSNYHDVAFSPDSRLLVAGGNDWTVKLWHAAPVPAKRRIESQAWELVARLFIGLHLRERVIQALENDPELDEALREMAIYIATRHFPNDSHLLNRLSWRVASAASHGMDEYRLAVSRAEAAVELEPDHYSYRNTLGVAYYRAGRFERAVESLELACQLHGKVGTAFDWYTLAMCHQQLGETEKARAYFERATSWWENAQDLPAHWPPQLERFRQEAAEVLGLEEGR